MEPRPEASDCVRLSAVGFPGQGGDWLAALRIIDANSDHALVRLLNRRLRETIGNDFVLDSRGQTDVRISQPTVYVAGLLGAERAGIEVDDASIVAAVGHSLGELTASAFAGAVDSEAGLELAVARGRITHGELANRPGQMLLVRGPDAGAVEWALRLAESTSQLPLDVAVHNGDGQFVLAGPPDAVAACLDIANEMGMTARRLPIGGAFHSSLLAGAVEELLSAASEVTWSEPKVPIVLSTAPAEVVEAADLPGMLSRSLVLPVRWPESVVRLASIGVQSIIDAGPGDTIVRLARLNPLVPAISIGADSYRAE